MTHRSNKRTRKEIDDVINLSQMILKLKRIQRKGWIKAGVKKPESVADHSFSTTLLSMIIGDLFCMDTERLIRMALLHDLHESVIGDLTPEDKHSLRNQLKLKEKKATKTIVDSLPHRIERKYQSLIDDYRNQRSKESKVLWDIDKIEMSLQAIRYIKQGYSTKSMIQFLKSTELNLSTEVGKILFEAIESKREE